jgi:site-specific DNA recombinase
MDKLIPVVGYIRVSTDEQVEGFSLDAQEERIRAYAKSQDYTLIEIYRDNGYSAKNLNRSGIKKLLEDMKKRRFGIVLVYRLDRLTRRLKDLNDLVELFEKYRIKFQSVTEPFETKTAAGRLMMNVFGGFAQFERELNSERVYTGLKKRFEAGNWMAAAPYGYRMQKGKLVINPDEAEMVRKIYQMYLDSGYGLTDLARRLNDEGYRSRNGKRWRPSVLYWILTYKVYIGYTVWSGK